MGRRACPICSGRHRRLSSFASRSLLESRSDANKPKHTYPAVVHVNSQSSCSGKQHMHGKPLATAPAPAPAPAGESTNIEHAEIFLESGIVLALEDRGRCIHDFKHRSLSCGAVRCASSWSRGIGSIQKAGIQPCTLHLEHNFIFRRARGQHGEVLGIPRVSSN